MKKEEFEIHNSTKALPDVFRELEQARMGQATNSINHKKDKHSKKQAKKKGLLHINALHIILIALCALMITVISTNRIFAADELKVKEEMLNQLSQFEINESSLNMQQIMTDNMSVIKTKEVAIEERELPYSTIYTTSDQLPLDEEVTVQKGENGSEQVKLVKNYENDVFVDETIIERTILRESKGKMIQVGTSTFLSKHQVHIGDKMYATEDTALRKEPNKESAEVVKISRYLDVTLLQVEGEWCKVSYNDNKEGYIECNVLTSEATTPKVVEQNRIQKILLTVDLDMELNKPSGLTLKDFKRVLSNNRSDVNNIFSDNAEAFYNVEKKYQVNGIFLAALGIHESAWGTSTISVDKKNLFGYGAYDSNPYDGAYTFETYEEGIDLLGQVIAKHYINAPGVTFYEGEVATGKYYNGPTLSGINVRYSTDENWGSKVFSIMQTLYAKL